MLKALVNGTRAMDVNTKTQKVRTNLIISKN